MNQAMTNVCKWENCTREENIHLILLIVRYDNNNNGFL